MSSAQIMEIEGLDIGYHVGGDLVPAVSDVSLEVAPGEVVAVVGESGSGKSTTAHAVIGLLPSNALITAGSVRLRGRDITGLPDRRFSRIRGAQVGLVPQDPTVSLNPVMRVGAQIVEALVLHRKAPRRLAGVRAIELLESVGIREAPLRATQFPHQLSGGMRQRVLIAMAMACNPPLIIADEPTSALDVTVQREVLDQLGALTRDHGTSVLLITHDLAVAGDRADRVAVMQKGRVVEVGTADEVLDRPRDPYTRALIAAAPSFHTAPAMTRQPAPEPAEATAVLEFRGVTKQFPRGRRQEPFTAVDEVSFSIPRGTTFGLVGESGSGKSTSARMAMRLEVATAGTVLFDGRDLAGADRRQVKDFRRRAQFVYQSPFASLDPRFTVAQIIEEPMSSFGVGDRRERAARVAELLERIALPASAATKRPRELSGGQRQRVAIARALALRPEFVVLDEPVSALDVSVQAQILDLLLELQREDGLTYLFISHDLAVVRMLSDTIGIMRQGRMVEQGPAEAVLDHPADEYTRELLAAIPGRERAERAGRQV